MMIWQKQLEELKLCEDEYFFADLMTYLKTYEAAVKNHADNIGNVALLVDLNKAENMLKKKVADIWNEKHPAERVFSTQAEVVDYLSAEGYRLGKSKFSADKSAGRIKTEKDGSFTLKSVLKYAETLERPGEIIIDGGSELSKIELEKEQIKLRQLRREEEIALGKYILREDYERDLANRAILFRNDLQNFVMREATAVVSLVKGDDKMTPDLIVFMTKGLGAMLQGYADKKVVSVDVDG